MYKLLIADDEQIVIDSLRYILEKNFQNIEIAATARSGREAVEKVDSVMPDIIFMDIKMPGIDGIEAVREIKSRYRHIVIIILTAFDQFDYAREALKLGVTEYLLKPVNRVKIIDTVKKAIDIVQAERSKRQLELELKEKIGNVLPMLESGFIYSMILFEDNGTELLNYRRLFNIEETGGFVMTVEFGEAGKNGNLGNKIGYSIRSQSFYPFLRETVKSISKSIISPVMLNRVIICLPVDPLGDEYPQRLEAVNMAEQLYERLSSKVDAELKIGMGRVYESFEMLPSSYEESVKALHYIETSGIMHFMDIPSANPIGSRYPSYREKLFLQKISLGEKEESLYEFNILFDWLINEYGVQSLKVKNKLLELVFLVRRTTWENSEDNSSGQQDCLEDILTLDSESELHLWCRRHVEEAVEQINLFRERKTGGITGKAKEFINRSYTSAITLEDVSREVNVSPQYFSKLFKEETGENFIDYLTGMRINRAKVLLAEKELSVKEICFQIGYGDPNYFSRIFRKIVGVTPTEYKDAMMGS